MRGMSTNNTVEAADGPNQQRNNFKKRFSSLEITDYNIASRIITDNDAEDSLTTNGD